MLQDNDSNKQHHWSYRQNTLPALSTLLLGMRPRNRLNEDRAKISIRLALLLESCLFLRK